VAAVLRLQPEEVVHHRAAALDRLAADLGIYDDAERARLSDLLAELPAEEWPDDTANGTPAGQGPAEPPAVADQPAASKPPAVPKPVKRNRRRRPLLAAGVIVAGAGDEGGGGSAGAAASAGASADSAGHSSAGSSARMSDNLARSASS